MKVGDLVTWVYKPASARPMPFNDDIGLIISLTVISIGSIRKGFDDTTTRVRVWWGLNTITEHNIDYVEAI